MLRNMATIYIFNGDKVLLLYRIGSRVVPPSWCGIGGHFEPEELNDPEACVLRELFEETGIAPGDISGLMLRYIVMRLKGGEIRQNFYFFADLKKCDFIIPQCDEGILEWVDTDKLFERDMPKSAYYALHHYFAEAKRGNRQFAGVLAENGIAFAELTEF